MIDRRRFLGTAAGSLIAMPLAIHAQQQMKVARIGYLSLGSLEPRASAGVALDVFRQALRERGYIDGQNIAIELRSAEGKTERLPALATELVRLKVDLIVAGSTVTSRAAKQATSTLPIVAFAMTDPVGDGLVANLARPEGNVTGLTGIGRELLPKNLGLLKEAVPTAARVAALWQPGALGEQTTRDMLNDTQTAAQTLRVQLRLLAVQGPDEFDRAFATMIHERCDALILFPSVVFFLERQRIVDLVAKYRLPAMYGAREFVELGGLMSHGASQLDLVRRAALYVDKILKGAKPGDLPVEQPSKFELVINLKTAKSLGLTIPQPLLLRADEVIQ